MATSGYLRALDDDALVALLRRRPDLAAPSPVTLASLAARATSRVSLERALAGVDAAVLQAVEAVVALRDDPPDRAGAVAAVAGDDPAPADAALVGRALDEAAALALVWPDGDRLRAAPGLADLLGPYPAGLAPAGPDDRTARPAASAPDEPAAPRAAPAPDGPAVDPAATAPDGPAVDPPATGPDGPGVDPAATAPDERAVLDALTWGPPVGVVPPPGTPAADAVARLLAAGLLVRGGPGQVVLPRAVALALRDGRTHRTVARPPAPDLPVRPAAAVDAESAAAAERTVRLVARLVAAWGEDPPGVLRAGGLGVRDLRALARALEVDEAEAAFTVELAGAAGLVADDEEERPRFAPTDDADAWLRGDLAARWARLAVAWLGTERVPWLVGTRRDAASGGAAHAALEPDLHRRWAPRLRAAVLDVLAAVPPGAAPGPDDVLAALRWRTPRSVPPAGAVVALLAEAERLGVLGAGALAPAGRALAGRALVGGTGAGGTGTDRAGADGTGAAGARAGDGMASASAGATGGIEAAAATALARSLPAPVDDLLLQGDLTGIVPGRPGDRLAALLDRTARVESRGGALTVRFTPETIRAALDTGATADELLAGLAAAARGGVPQPLEYLVRDTARRHGVLRAGLASSYLRADDPALLAGLPDDPRLSGLGLRLLAPTVLAAAVSPVDLVAALRAHGLAPVVEGPDGLVVHAPAPVHRSRPRPRRQDAPPDETARLTALVRRLRRDGAGTPAPTAAPTPEPASGTADPAAALLLLREAAAERSLVWVDVVGGRGVLERRLLRPLSVDGGRLRAVDPAREAELVVAVHRIAAAEPAS